jgi:hypothetical protein
MTTAKWTSIQERSRIYAILLQDLTKRAACRCGVEMLLHRTPITRLVPWYIDDSGQCHFNNVEWHMCLDSRLMLSWRVGRYWRLGTLHTSFLPHFMWWIMPKTAEYMWILHRLFLYINYAHLVHNWNKLNNSAHYWCWNAADKKQGWTAKLG